jgi:hypothetical protein
MIFGHSFLQRIYKVVIQSEDLTENSQGFQSLTPCLRRFRCYGVNNNT